MAPYSPIVGCPASSHISSQNSCLSAVPTDQRLNGICFNDCLDLQPLVMETGSQSHPWFEHSTINLPYYMCDILCIQSIYPHLSISDLCLCHLYNTYIYNTYILQYIRIHVYIYIILYYIIFFEVSKIHVPLGCHRRLHLGLLGLDLWSFASYLPRARGENWINIGCNIGLWKG